MQLAAASVVPWGGLSEVTFDRLVADSICHADADHAGQDRAPARQHRPDCAVCVLCQAVAHVGVLLGPSVFVLAAPAALAAGRAHLPPARAPPALLAAAASARGPPVLI